MPRGALAGAVALLCGWLLRFAHGIRDEGAVENVMQTDMRGGRTELDELRISFFYTKEESSCFKDGDIDRLIDSTVRERLLTEDMVVFLQLAKRPPSPLAGVSFTKAPEPLKLAHTKACEGKGGVPLDVQMGAKLKALGRTFSQVQIENRVAAAEGKVADQALLSVWYNASKVTVQKGFVFKNRFRGDLTSCITTKDVPLRGNFQVTRDITPCDPADGWEEYSSTKSVLGLSFLPTGGEMFAVLGANLPIAYSRGKNEMTKRAVEGAKTVLGTNNTFIIGDMNTRLLPDAWKVCEDPACHEPNLAKALQLIKPEGPLITPGTTPAICENIGLVEGGYETAKACKDARDALVACRKQCLAELLCDRDMYNSRAYTWYFVWDVKRGAGDYDILPKYFEFMTEFNVGRGLSDIRWPTYKKVKGADNPSYCKDPAFRAFCPKNPCYQVASNPTGAECVTSMKACFQLSSDSKPDIIPDDDPMEAQRGLKMTKPQLGWLDALGYTKWTRSNWHVEERENHVPLEFTMGDHASLVAAVKIRLRD